ncbi:helix-turn-helix domain-containing protein [Pokkaliibacter plantistimulans]|nr:helix-turn-helix domain-containing protein [Pokkaliibacter plantistimulans]
MTCQRYYRHPAATAAVTGLQPAGGCPLRPSWDDDQPAGLLHNSEQQLIASVVAAHNGNLAAAARELGISRTTLYRKIRANPHLVERSH